ncbi:MAG: gamma-glutamyl-gamma-aminobutyrate hydrolase family protein [Planctomycetota bacterium]|nr:gamma-glutamyl-gamma-aminobutyrate hydrolase family protein [Planctomycetota bacterium]
MDRATTLIGVNPFLVEGRPARLVVRTPYLDAVRRAGGTPLIVTPRRSVAEIEFLLERVDGLLLTGGDDFDTERIGLGPTHRAALKTPPEKQDFDFALARAALERGIPILGVCYGMQLMALAEGASLLQHLPDDRPGCRPHAGGAEHPVIVKPRTKLADLVGVERMIVVSRHHQALSAVGSQWIVSASDDEGLIEAIERPNHPFAVGVQWHPELSPPSSPHGRIFGGLVAAARAAVQEAVS